MMNGPYYRCQSRSVPVHQPKVVSIPVHFISSDQDSKHSSALKIQKVFKGHTVRKALKSIVSIKNQVNEIEKRLLNNVGFVRVLRNDAKERLRVNETLMSLLFKLDSVRGFENGVREVRKSVAKKAVALQERVDSIAQSFEEDDDDVTYGEETGFCDVSDSVGKKVNEEDAKEDVAGGDVSNDEEKEHCDVSNSIPNKVNEEYVKDVVVDEGVKENSLNKCDDDVSRSCCDHEMAVNEDQKCDDDNDISRRCFDKGMVEKLVSDNAKMMRIMIQISERNEMQTRMINSLSKRVEQLEKVFLTSDKSRRRKKCYTRREKDGFGI